MFLFWSVIGGLTVVRSHLPYGPAAPVRDVLPGLLACTAWHFPWAVPTPLVFRLERHWPPGPPGWPSRLAVLSGISIPGTHNGVGPPAEMSGMKIRVGLGSTCQRLAKMLAGRQSFSIQRPPGGGAEVHIGIPFRFASSVSDAGLNEETPVAHR